jgi:hypothetical protein
MGVISNVASRSVKLFPLGTESYILRLYNRNGRYIPRHNSNGKIYSQTVQMESSLPREYSWNGKLFFQAVQIESKALLLACTAGMERSSAPRLYSWNGKLYSKAVQLRIWKALLTGCKYSRDGRLYSPAVQLEPKSMLPGCTAGKECYFPRLHSGDGKLYFPVVQL